MIALAHDAFTLNAINDALITPSHVTKIHPHVRSFNGVSRTNAAADPNEITPAPRIVGVCHVLPPRAFPVSRES